LLAAAERREAVPMARARAFARACLEMTEVARRPLRRHSVHSTTLAPMPVVRLGDSTARRRRAAVRLGYEHSRHVFRRRGASRHRDRPDLRELASRSRAFRISFAFIEPGIERTKSDALILFFGSSPRPPLGFGPGLAFGFGPGFAVRSFGGFDPLRTAETKFAEIESSASLAFATTGAAGRLRILLNEVALVDHDRIDPANI
jgi:hypothetical protein